MIWIGIDDTDTLDTPGTNQLVRWLMAQHADRYRLEAITRHQLFFDPRVPYTSHNGSASWVVTPLVAEPLETLIASLRHGMQAGFNDGSDPGLCVATAVPPEVTAFARRCQSDVVTQAEAHTLARTHGIHLEGLGGTEDGVIGALAAIGLAVTHDDGRVIQYRHWPDDLTGIVPVSAVRERGVVVRVADTGTDVTTGTVDLGKKLRPNWRSGAVTLVVEPSDTANSTWLARREP